MIKKNTKLTSLRCTTNYEGHVGDIFIFLQIELKCLLSLLLFNFPPGHMFISQDILRRWDQGSRQQRLSILIKFIATHRNSTGAEIEKDLGAGAILFFTRVTAWLRLTYMLSYELATQLSAISLFLQGQKFLTNFMEVGGIQTLLDIICHRTKVVEDKENTLLILIHISNSGRIYREMICDDVGFPEDRVKWAEEVLGMRRDDAKLQRNPEAVKAEIHQKLSSRMELLQDEGKLQKAESLETDVTKALSILTGLVPYSGVDMLVQALLREQNDSCLELFGSLFMSLGHGNPRKRSLIDTGLLRALRYGCDQAALAAAASLRSLQLSKQYYQGSTGSQAFGLLTHNNINNSTHDVDEADQVNRVEDSNFEISELIDTFTKLLSKDNVKLRFEGTELLATAAQNNQLWLPILSRMLSIIEGSSGFEDQQVSTSRFKASAARVLGKVLHCRQESDPITSSVANLFTNHKVCLLLLTEFKHCDIKDMDLQRECMNTLQIIANFKTDSLNFRFVEERGMLLRSLGEQTFSALENKESFSIDGLRAIKQLLQD